MELEGSLLFQEELASGHYCEPNESIPHTLTLFLKSHFKFTLPCTTKVKLGGANKLSIDNLRLKESLLEVFIVGSGPEGVR
jgi:hypothetical protein